MKTIITTFLSMAALTVMCQIPQNGLLAHFNFNGTQGFNSNVNGYTIIPNVYTSNSRTGGATKPTNTFDRYNKTDSAGFFEYTSYQYELADNGGTKNSKLKIKKEITFGGWMMLWGYDNFNVTPILFGVWGPTYATYGFQGNVGNGNIHMFLSSNTANNQTITTNIASEGSQGSDYYHHVMGTLSSDDTMRLYFQGRLVAKKKFVGDSLMYFDYSNSKKYFSMGAQYTSNGWNGTGFNGGLDDVVIYDRALSAQEIWTLFNNSSRCTNNTGVRSGHLGRATQGTTKLLRVTDTTVWHNDNCEFEWYANNNYGLTTMKSGGNSISINQNGTYKVKVVHRATRCYYWTNDVVVTDLGGGTNGISNNEPALTSIAPNPVNDKLQINSNRKIERIIIYGLDGKMISSVKGESELQQTINTQWWQPGVYLVHVICGNEKSITRIIKN